MVPSVREVGDRRFGMVPTVREVQDEPFGEGSIDRWAWLGAARLATPAVGRAVNWARGLIPSAASVAVGC